MDNNELSIEQLQAINGGGVFAKLDGFSSRISRSNQRRVIIHPDFIDDPIHKVGLRGIGDAVERAVAVPAFL
ncbi:CCRG-2 family RiPP [Prochlorococcus marinus]|uniref:CCRG-2 family RiPP n=1 Tax=Prochlorococcus marinus TaxID=1219 RepID=UPI001F2FFCD8|nr:CCRG-2 family RiPP [Prochlorococcus marinus]